MEIGQYLILSVILVSRKTETSLSGFMIKVISVKKTIESYKLASIVTLDEDFVNDAGFDIEKYLTG